MHLKPPENIEMPRLILRLPSIIDAEPIFNKYAQDPRVTKYLPWSSHESIDITRDFLRRCTKCWGDGSAFPWVIIRKDDQEILGMIELRIDGFRADFGFVIAHSYWGKGYATEAATAVVQWAMCQDSIYRVWAFCDVENVPSVRVLEKAGLEREGVLRSYAILPNLSELPRDMYCYAIVKT